MASPQLVSITEALQSLLARFEIRLFLSAGIIISLLPYPWIDDFDGFFLLVFGTEFLFRVFLIFRAKPEEKTPEHTQASSRSWRWPPIGSVALLLLDLLALLSFLPFASAGAESNRFLRIFRLTRMLLLIGYWAPLARDIWVVLARRERARQVVLMGVFVLALSFTGAVIIENVAIQSHASVDFNNDGEINNRDRHFLTLLWWSFRQIQDPGNMISGPIEATAMMVSLALTVFGLFLISFLIGLGTDVVRELMELSNLREPGLRGHTVIVNITPSTRRLLDELTRYYKKLVPEGRLSREWLRELLRNTKRGVRRRPYLIVGHTHDPPDFLRNPDFSHVVYRPWTTDDEALLRRTDMQKAQRVMLLANLDSPDPDAETLQTLLTLVERDGNPRRKARDRPQLLIAEILDESAIPAARAAIAGSESRAFIVPSERLLALVMASTIRRPASTQLLTQLLASRGAELYTCYFDVPGLAYCRETPPIPSEPRAAMDYLLARSRNQQDLVPLGLLTRQREGDPQELDVAVHLNPNGDDDNPSSEPAPCRGFVALAANFALVRDFADTLSEPAPAAPTDTNDDTNNDGKASIGFSRAPTPCLRKILICGFRSATVSLIEALVIAEPNAEILVLVDSEAKRLAALDDFDARTNLVANGLLSERYRVFSVDESDVLRGHRHRAPEVALGRIQIAVGDYTSSRCLVNLPRDFGHAADTDVIALLSIDHDTDAQIAKALMKLEALIGHAERRAQVAGHRHARPRIAAELFDSELARRLRRHFQDSASDEIRILSTQSMRALFLYQSVIVPSFDEVYAELLGPWGQSLLRMQPRGLTQRTTYREIADALTAERAILVAIELRAADGSSELHVGVESIGGQAFSSERLISAWVIASDQCNPATNSSPTGSFETSSAG
ncbi:MAG TPA: ion transporter [Nannocystis exedens]|nr:ion transporter [Nannocystis exedens]